MVPFCAKTPGERIVCSPAGMESRTMMRTMVVARPTGKILKYFLQLCSYCFILYFHNNRLQCTEVCEIHFRLNPCKTQSDFIGQAYNHDTVLPYVTGQRIKNACLVSHFFKIPFTLSTHTFLIIISYKAIELFI